MHRSSSLSFLLRSGAFGFVFLLGFLVLLVSSVGTALAQQGTPNITDDQVNRVAKQLYCPVCENIPLDVCPTQACAQWRGLIKEKLTAGWTEKQIKDYFVEQYGARVLATPPASGLNWLVYVIPPVAILAGIYVLYRAMLAWRRPAHAAAQADAPKAAISDEYIRRLEEELKKKT